jgi:hypothetical protein
MTDIVERMKATACPDNTGCMSIRMCVCDVVGDAVDEIMRLRVLANVLNKDNRKLETENKDLLKEVGAATALLNNVTAEMSNARVEIREMNRRIDMLRGRKS